MRLIVGFSTLVISLVLRPVTNSTSICTLSLTMPNRIDTRLSNGNLRAAASPSQRNSTGKRSVRKRPASCYVRTDINRRQQVCKFVIMQTRTRMVYIQPQSDILTVKVSELAKYFNSHISQLIISNGHVCHHNYSYEGVISSSFSFSDSYHGICSLCRTRSPCFEVDQRISNCSNLQHCLVQ